jgi:3-deoxy-D-manno-octulosonic-acid transferase
MRSLSEQIGTGMLFRGYSAFSTVCSPIAAAALLLSARGRRRYAERFGGWADVGAVPWWFHGASVGEVQGLLPILSRIKALRPQDKVLLTATSPTGLERGAEHAEYTRLLPLDAGWCVRRALSRMTPQRLVVCETELWPVLLHAVARRGIPAHVVNGRISDYTVRWYERISSIIEPLMRQFRSICVPYESQRARYVALGARSDAVVVTGHSKYDAEPKIGTDELRAQVRYEFFPRAPKEAPIVVLGSVRPGEEQWWFEAYTEIRRGGKPLKLLVAPRHAEKFSFFAERISSLGLPFVRWSEREERTEVDADILLLDTMGKLEAAYAVADLAFVGATLVDVGGHNPIEPAMYAAPVVVGPHISVIRDIIEDMRSASGVIDVSDRASVVEVMDRAARRDSTLRDVGSAGYGVWQRHRGASQRILSVLEDHE